MKRKIYFSGKEINLDQNPEEVKNELQDALDRYFPTPNKFAIVEDYKESGDETIEFTVKRNYENGSGCAFKSDFICDKDASLLTGLHESTFQPFVPGKALLAPLIPWYDNMVYTPVSSFALLWEKQIKTLTSQEVKKIQVAPFSNQIIIKIGFPK